MLSHASERVIISGVCSVPFFSLAISRVFLPAHVFLSSLGNTPVTEIGGSPFPHGGVILNVGGLTEAVWSVTLLPAMIMPASLAAAHQPVPMYWLHSGRSSHS